MDNPNLKTSAESIGDYSLEKICSYEVEMELSTKTQKKFFINVRCFVFSSIRFLYIYIFFFLLRKKKFFLIVFFC